MRCFRSGAIHPKHVCYSSMKSLLLIAIYTLALKTIRVSYPDTNHCLFDRGWLLRMLLFFFFFLKENTAIKVENDAPYLFITRWIINWIINTFGFILSQNRYQHRRRYHRNTGKKGGGGWDERARTGNTSSTSFDYFSSKIEKKYALPQTFFFKNVAPSIPQQLDPEPRKENNIENKRCLSFRMLSSKISLRCFLPNLVGYTVYLAV